MRYLGIDYGSKRIGLALSDEAGKMAFPHSVVPNDARALETIANIITGVGAKGVVVGESKDFSMKDNKIQADIDSFAKQLEAKEMDLEISFEPEFMTSVEALHLQGKNEMLDASAATLILQSYLDKKNLV